jgi:predicted nucleotide-binding protein
MRAAAARTRRATEEAGLSRPSVFIGSSTEGLEIAKCLQRSLSRVARCQPWSRGVFGLSQTNIESLVAATRKSHFAILVLTPDDLATKRGKRKSIPRDNVIFELGLFMGALGREKTFIVHSRDVPIELPSDLAGITTATFSVEDDDLQGAVDEPSAEIELAITQRVGDIKDKLQTDAPRTYTLSEFLEIEKQARDEVWILSPHSLFSSLEVDPFYDVVASNVARRVRYRYFVQKIGDYKAQLELLVKRLSTDERVTVDVRPLIYLDKLGSSDWPCPFVIIDPASSKRGFVIVSKDTHSSHYWVEISPNLFTRFITSRSLRNVEAEPVHDDRT